MEQPDLMSDTTYAALKGTLATHFKEFNRIWTTYGYAEEQIARRKRTIEKHFNDLFGDMVREENKRLNEKRMELDAFKEECVRLVRDLELGPQDDPIITVLGNGRDLTLLQEESVLLEIVQDLRKRKEARMARYNEISKKVEDLSAKLGEVPFALTFVGIPTDPQVDELARHCHTLQQEEQNRLDKYKGLKTKLKQHFISLEKFPASHLERIIILGQPIAIPEPLSVAVIKEVVDLESTLASQIEQNVVKAETLWQKIRDLWKRLKTDEEIILAFENTHKWTPLEVQSNKRKSQAVKYIAKPSLITGLQSELARLEEEKRQNIASFIKELRDELIQLWQACYTGEGHQYILSSHIGSCFTDFDFSNEVYSEELLELHEKEVEKWRAYAEEQKKLIEGVTKRQEMWIKWLELDIKSDDPARFANRGGALLREEKERKTLEKQIPKLEKELTKLSEKHEDKYRVKFTVFGEAISAKIEREWNDFHVEKEARKNARVRSKKPGMDDGKSVMMTSMVGSSRKRPAPQTPSTSVAKPGQTPKRGKMILATPKSPFQPRIPPTSTMRNANVPTMKINPLSSTIGLPEVKIVKKNWPVGQAAKPPTGRPTVKKYPGQSIVNKYRKSLGRPRLTLNKTGSSGSDKTLSCGSLPSFNPMGSTFSPLVDIENNEQFDFPKIASAAYASESLQGKDVENVKADVAKPLIKLSANTTRFVTPKPRAAMRTVNSAAASGRKTRKSLRLQNKEQLPQVGKSGAQEEPDIVSPVSTYSEFSKDLLGQSTLNSSVAVGAVGGAREPLSNLGGSTTPSRNRNPQPKMTPAKSAVPYNNRF